MRVLVVESNLLLAERLKRHLQAAGHAVRVAHSVIEAHAAPSVYDRGILGLELSDGSGITLAAELLFSGKIGDVEFLRVPPVAPDPHLLDEAPARHPRRTGGPDLASTRPDGRSLADASPLSARAGGDGG